MRGALNKPGARPVRAGGALAADAMPPGYLGDQNVVAIIPEGSPATSSSSSSTARTSSGLGTACRTTCGAGRPWRGLATVDGYTMAASCPKLATWEVMKFITDPGSSSTASSRAASCRPSRMARSLIPELSVLPDAEIVASAPGFTEPRYPWAASGPRWALQAALQGTQGSLSAEEALAQAQRETDYWLSQQ